MTKEIQTIKIKPGQNSSRLRSMNRQHNNCYEECKCKKPNQTPNRNLGLENACQPVKNSVPVSLEIEDVLIRCKPQGPLSRYLFPPMVVCIKKFSPIVTVAKISHLSRQENMVKHRCFVFMYELPYL